MELTRKIKMSKSKSHKLTNIMKTRWLVLCLILFVSVSAFSQQLTTGVVTDINGIPLIGASVRVDGSKNEGTITDLDGKFSLKTSVKAMLVVSYIGYTTQMIKINGPKVLTVNLLEDSGNLDEVVVVAYGKQKKESVIGAISQTRGKELMRAGVQTLSNTFAGRISGLVTDQQSGMPGADDSKIYIRGLASFTGDNQPLVLVDGIERSLNNLDPSEIESVSVLKDASATAVYGVKGGNGVILVTTKRGQEGKMEITAGFQQILKQSINQGIQENSYTTLYDRDQLFRTQNYYGKVLGSEILNHYQNPSSIYDPYIYPNVDAWTHGIKPSTWDTHFSVAARGGTKFVKYFITLSYLGQTDLLKTNQPLYDADFSYKRINYRMNFDFDISKTTKVSVSSGGYSGTSSYGGVQTQSDGAKILNDMYTQPPYITPYEYPSWFVEHFPDSNYPTVSDRVAGNVYSPGTTTGWYRHNYSGTTRTIQDRLGVDVALNQNLDKVTPGLSFKANFSYNNTSDWNGGNIVYNSDFYTFGLVGNTYKWDRYINQSQALYSDVLPPYQQTLTRNSSLTTSPSYNYVYGGQLNYNRKFGSHNVTGLALFERRISQNGFFFPDREEKWSMRGTYDYKSKYMLEATLGISGSERFAPANRFGYFPSVAAGWNIIKEDFFKKNMPKEFSNLKVRYSYGETGNDQVNDFLYISQFTNGSTYNIGAPGTSQGIYTINEGAVPNTSARWERAKKTNLGVDFGFFNNALTLSGDFFSENRDGILMNRNSLSSIFGQSVKALNIGSTKRHGFEIEASYLGSMNPDFNYWIKGNLNFNENRITNYDEAALAPDYSKLAGKPIGTIFTQKNIGYYQDLDEMANYSLNQTSLLAIGSDKLLDFNGDGVIDIKDNIAMNNTNRPDITYGFSSGFEYKNFEMNFLIQGVSSVSRNWSTASNPMFTNDPGDFYIKVIGRDDIWKPSNRNAAYANWGGWNPGSKGVIDASYIRLKSLEVSYSIKGEKMKQLGISSAKVSLQGSNLLTWAPGYILGDPENESTGVNGYNLGFSFYPIPRLITLGIQISL